MSARTCQISALVNAGDNESAYEVCTTGAVKGGHLYPVPFETASIAGAGGTDTIEIEPDTIKRGAVPVAMLLDDGTGNLVTVQLDGPTSKEVGILAARGDITDEWPAWFFVNREVLHAQLPNLPPDIGEITPSQSLAMTFTNGGSAPEVVRGSLLLWVPDDAEGAQFAKCELMAVINAVAAYRNGCAGNGMPKGVYPVPFRHTFTGNQQDLVELLPSLAGGLVPMAMYINPELTDADFTIDSIKGPGGHKIGILGQDISDNWSLNNFQDLRALRAQIPNLPPNIGRIYASKGMKLAVTAANFALVPTFDGILWVYNPGERSTGEE